MQVRPEPSAIVRSPPRRWGRRCVALLFVSAPFIAVAALALQAPDFYNERRRQPEGSRELSKSFFNRGMRFANSLLSTEGRWRESFDEQGLNAWLEHDFEPNFQKRLPFGVHDPRVAMEEGIFRVGFLWGLGPMQTVVQVSVGVWVPKNNVLAIELHGAWAGRLPLPTTYVRRIFEQTAAAGGAEIQWKRNGPTLVGLIKLPSVGRNVLLRRAEVLPGVINFSGQNINTMAGKEVPVRR